ncbi:hypothetical protein PtB15_15B31 [Puccinia triticina]|nr:hypothetical protein PtB15_15B31 [Puccinia triticina]
MNIDLLSMTWEEFQILALEHVKQSHTVNPLFCLLHDANYIGALEWRVTLLGHPYYTAANKIQVASDALFSKFAEAAYNFFPNAVVFKMIMREPNDPPADSMPADGNSVKRAHPVDANGERRPTIALRTPGAYRFQKYPAVSSSGNQGLSTGLSNTVQAGPDDGVNASPLGGRGHGAVQNNISQSTGSRSVTRAVTKDGPKGMSTPKTHEVGPSPLATNTTAPRVPAGRQPPAAWFLSHRLELSSCLKPVLPTKQGSHSALNHLSCKASPSRGSWTSPAFIQRILEPDTD